MSKKMDFLIVKKDDTFRGAVLKVTQLLRYLGWREDLILWRDFRLTFKALMREENPNNSRHQKHIPELKKISKKLQEKGYHGHTTVIFMCIKESEKGQIIYEDVPKK